MLAITMNPLTSNDDELKAQLLELTKLTARLEVPQTRCEVCGLLLDTETAAIVDPTVLDDDRACAYSFHLSMLLA